MKLVCESLTRFSNSILSAGPAIPSTSPKRAIQKRDVSCFSSPWFSHFRAKSRAAARCCASVIAGMGVRLGLMRKDNKEGRSPDRRREKRKVKRRSSPLDASGCKERRSPDRPRKKRGGRAFCRLTSRRRKEGRSSDRPRKKREKRASPMTVFVCRVVGGVVDGRETVLPWGAVSRPSERKKKGEAAFLAA